MIQKTVYRWYNRKPVFTGTEEECWQWIFNRAHVGCLDGRKLVRMAQIENNIFYDIGSAIYYIPNGTNLLTQKNINDIILVESERWKK